MVVRMLRRWASVGALDVELGVAAMNVPTQQAHSDCWDVVLQEVIDGTLPSLERIEAARVDALDT